MIVSKTCSPINHTNNLAKVTKLLKTYSQAKVHQVTMYKVNTTANVLRDNAVTIIMLSTNETKMCSFLNTAQKKSSN